MYESELILFGSLPVDTRVCVCVGMFAGVGSVALAGVTGICKRNLTDILSVLVSDHRLCVTRKGTRIYYHITDKGRAYIESECERVRGEGLAIIARARLCQWPRLALLDQMEQGIRSGL